MARQLITLENATPDTVAEQVRRNLRAALRLVKSAHAALDALDQRNDEVPWDDIQFLDRDVAQPLARLALDVIDYATTIQRKL
jgi:hypothetical protein